MMNGNGVSAMMSGAVLAGGQNRRMNGRMKALLPFGACTILDRILSQMRQACQQCFIVAADHEQSKPLEASGVSIVYDIRPGQGPLSGLQAALTYSRSHIVWVSASDMPFANAAAANLMQQKLKKTGAQAIIPHIGDRLHPLQAIYDRSCLEVVSNQLNQGNARMMAALELLHTEVIEEAEWLEAGVDLRFVTNINTPEQYREALLW